MAAEDACSAERRKCEAEEANELRERESEAREAKTFAIEDRASRRLREVHCHFHREFEQEFFLRKKQHRHQAVEEARRCIVQQEFEESQKRQLQKEQESRQEASKQAAIELRQREAVELQLKEAEFTCVEQRRLLQEARYNADLMAREQLAFDQLYKKNRSVIAAARTKDQGSSLSGGATSSTACGGAQTFLTDSSVHIKRIDKTCRSSKCSGFKTPEPCKTAQGLHSADNVMPTRESLHTTSMNGGNITTLGNHPADFMAFARTLSALNPSAYACTDADFDENATFFIGD